MHKIIFNNRLIPGLEAMEVILMEVIGGRRSQAATHLVLNKKLISHIANAWKLLLITIYADATNCYSRAAHPFASLCAQYFRLEIVCLAVLFRMTQLMKLFLRTSYSVLDSCYSEDEDKLFQGVTVQYQLCEWLFPSS